MTDQQSRYFTDTFVNENSASEILKLNEAIAEVVFGFERSGEPVHLDLDDENLERIGARIGLTLEEVRERIVRVVGNIASVPGPKAVFSAFLRATKRWNNLRETRPGSGLETPPALSLLAVLTMAAENMRRSDDDDERSESVRATNYYLRLSQLIGTDVWTPQETQKEYRIVAKEIWQSLKTWLDEWQDERGICTVTFPEVSGKSNWAVQMPISQALLRVADRENLHLLFKTRGLDPGIAVSRQMMALLLEEWCVSYSNGHLKNLWKKTDYRDSLILAAQGALVSWSGVQTDPKNSGDKGFTTKVALTFEASPLTKSVQFGIEIRTSGHDFPSFVDIQTNSGDFFRAQVRPGGPRIVQIVDDGIFESESLVTGMLRVKNEEAGLRGVRFPLPIAIFAASSFGRSYSEISALELGFRHGLLVRREMDPAGNILERVENVLAKVARPGWRVLTSSDYEGLPEDWVFIENVEFLTFPSASDIRGHLEILAPREIEKISFSDGFRVPGKRERWLVESPPSALAVFPYDSTVVIRVRDSSGTLLYEHSPSPRVAFVKILDLNLSPGSYVVEASADDGRPISSILHLIAADTPNPLAKETSRIVRHPISEAHGFGALSAQFPETVAQGLPSVRGLQLESLSDGVAIPIGRDNRALPVAALWKSVNRYERPVSHHRIKIEQAPPDSCVNSAHHWVLPPAVDAKRRNDWPAECRFCKLTKIFPGRPRQKKASSKSVQTKGVDLKKAPLSVDEVQKIPKIDDDESQLWDHALSVLCYLRNGSISELAQIALQVSSGSIGVDQVIRKLSVLGHIDVKLDEFCRPEAWSVSPPVLVMRSKTVGHLAGYRDSQMLNQFEVRVKDLGGTMRRLSIEGAPQLIEISLPESIDHESLVSGNGKYFDGMNIIVQRNAPMTLLAAIPSIIVIGQDCPQIPRPPYREINKWDGKTAQWVRSDNELAEGAYQNIGNGYIYTFNDRAVAPGEPTRCGTAALVKHWDSALRGTPLYFFNQETRELCTRLGADLPGLIARAVVACSGRLPIEDTKNRIVRYPEVDEATALAVARVLS